MNPVQIGHVRDALKQRFTDWIDMSDFAWPNEEAREDALLSRGLAALAIQIQQPCGASEAARAVFDGRDDHGLDAITVDTQGDSARITLVQAKWSRKGRARFGEDDVRNMIDGLERILQREFDSFNSRFQRHAKVLEQALDSAGPKITLVPALLRAEPLNSDVRTLLEKKINQLNYAGEMVDYEVLDLRDFVRAVLGDAAATKIKLVARLENYGREAEPYNAFFGTITAEDIASWYSDHGRALFARNIRDSLDLTDVNVKIRNTLLETPENFWYFSNGITLLCDSIKRSGSGRPGGVGDFHLTGASVVNGAQTVTAIHRACLADIEKAGQGRVLVRLISLEDCPSGFGDQVTTSTNTQNPIEDRDFKALDDIQITLQQDFAHRLHLAYAIKRSGQRIDEDKGCSMTEAALALAATHPNAEFAARAKRDTSALWEDRTYPALFTPGLDAYSVWRRVQVLRAVRARLKELNEGLIRRAAAMASYGDLLITHVVFGQLDTARISEPDTDWDAQLTRATQLTEDALNWVMNSIDAEYGPKSQVLPAMRNTERIRRVAQRAAKGMASGGPVPALESDYQVSGSLSLERGRHVDAVRTLVDAGRIEDGTVLEFRPVTRPERRDLAEWLEENPDRLRAVWRNSKTKQLQWQADGKSYSPSGLVKMMRREASGVDQQVQGTRHWHVPGEGSLADLAARVRAETGLDVGDEDEWADEA
ncbi:AIPR family protein [Actinomadura madurae]|uniref:AIPR family protein n=1 Tax=Actinomadura madurae TaxID=1993 RepID=UPI000D99F23E|nr:AIPR family protein [Actinomadura madurae]SPT60100.1 AIPR protein [Actinomadura madurae]